jgi:hypothetical protein
VNIDLTDDEAAALLRELNNIIKNDRYPLSPRVRTSREIRAKLPGAPAAPPPTRAPRHRPPPALGHADVLEPDGDRLIVCHRVHPDAGMMASRNRIAFAALGLPRVGRRSLASSALQIKDRR